MTRTAFPLQLHFPFPLTFSSFLSFTDLSLAAHILGILIAIEVVSDSIGALCFDEISYEVREGKFTNLSLIARAPMSMGCMSFISKVTEFDLQNVCV